MTYYAPIVAVFVTLLLIAAILPSRFGRKVRDIPNNRSLHSTPVPRIGGVGMVAGILSGWTLLPGGLIWWVVLPMLILSGVSLLDDIRGLTVRWRLLAHLVAAVLLAAGSGLAIRQGVWAALIVLLLTIWMTNLYNFMDGSDGLAGGMALFGFGSFGAGAWLGGHEMFALLNFSVAAAALGFLFFNFHPARVFMGDAGSIPLGFLAAALGISGWQGGYWPLWFPILVFSPFIADATVTLLKRTLRGEKLLQAHHGHYYQRLVRMGCGHRNTALAEYALMLLAGASSLWAIGLTDWSRNCLLTVWGIAYLVLMALVDRYWRDFQSAARKVADVQA